MSARLGMPFGGWAQEEFDLRGVRVFYTGHRVHSVRYVTVEVNSLTGEPASYFEFIGPLPQMYRLIVRNFMKVRRTQMS